MAPTVYVQAEDVQSQYGELNARDNSAFGSILKITRCTWHGGDRAADWRDTGGLHRHQGNHQSLLGGSGEDGCHLGHPKVASVLHPGPFLAAVLYKYT